MQEIYLDNSATTRVFPPVVETMRQVMIEDYGNPSSLHGKGFAAEKQLREVRKLVAGILEVKPGEIFFTSGGTEANNWAIRGTAYRYQARGKHIITSSVEHASVLYACKGLEEEGFEVTYLPVNEEGLVDPQDLKQAMRPDTILVTIMHVNNEVGTIQPLQQLNEVVREQGKALFHVDAIQGFPKLSLNLQALGIDLLSISAHKFHGPKGIGVLYAREGCIPKPLLVGGDQEKTYRAGTENVPGIAGMAQALEMVQEKQKQHPELLEQLKQSFWKEINKEAAPVLLNGSLSIGAPHILNVSFPGVSKGEVLVHWLENYGVYVSTGSACHSRRADPSHVLQAMGIKGERLTGAIRVSFGHENTPEQVDQAVKAFKEAVSELRQLEG